MPPNEEASIEHIKNLFIERKRHKEAERRELLATIDQEAKELELWIKTFGELQGALPKLLNGQPLPALPMEKLRAPKLPINELIDRYMTEVQSSDFTAANVTHWIKAQGYQTSTTTYNSVHDALRKRVERGGMVKQGPKFSKKGE